MTKAKRRPVGGRPKKPAARRPAKDKSAKLQIPDSCRVIGRFEPGFYDY